MSQQQLSLELPYEEIGKVAPRKVLRSLFTPIHGEGYRIPFNTITPRDGFNRKVFKGIPELADSIFEHGQKDEFVVDVKSDGTVKLEQGERRYKARLLMIERGQMKPTDLVDCEVNSSEVTEKDRFDNIWITNFCRQDLHVLDQATHVYRKKHLFSEKPLSNEQIAKELSVSRQTVDNLITVYEMPDDLKAQIKNEQISVTDAIKLGRDKKKLEKQADKVEEDSHKTSDAPTQFPQDELKDEMADLKALEIQAEQTKQREAEFERKELERLEKDAVLVPVTVDDLTPHIGKRLAANAMYEWHEDFTDERTGEVVPVKSSMIVIKQGVPISEQVIEDLKAGMVTEVWVLKEITAAPSVFTEPVAVEEKGKYDSDRPEIAFIQNIIKLADKLEMMVSKLDVPEGVKKDVADVVKWIQNDAEPLRDWIHSNKKQNKIR